MLRLYSNENFPLPVVEELRRLGCDVTTVQETGRAGQSWPDAEVLGFAAAGPPGSGDAEPQAFHPSLSC